jgi:transcriptional regulator with XRE-family HTH domain
MLVRFILEVVTVGETFASAGERIKILRQHKHLTQEQLGELAGLNPNYVGQVERGQRIPSVQTIHALAEALGVDPGFLLLSPGKSDSPISNLMALIAMATPEQVELITKIAETVVSSGYRVNEDHNVESR